jgi:hypothetical protein
MVQAAIQGKQGEGISYLRNAEFKKYFCAVENKKILFATARGGEVVLQRITIIGNQV